jgi:Domain of unknown function (DUF6457)
MSEWTDRLAETLEVAPLDAGQQDALLHASREIAHRVERKETPLAAFLLGVAVGGRTAAGADPVDALKEAVGAALALLPPAPPEAAG